MVEAEGRRWCPPELPVSGPCLVEEVLPPEVPAAPGSYLCLGVFQESIIILHRETSVVQAMGKTGSFHFFLSQIQSKFEHFTPSQVQDLQWNLSMNSIRAV